MKAMNRLDSWNTCFAAGTLVHTKEGLKPIEGIRVGDWVLSYPEDQVPPLHIREEHEYTYRKVTATFVHDDEIVCKLIALNLANGIEEVIKVTPNHPIHEKDAGWVPASQLMSAGNVLGSYNFANLLTNRDRKPTEERTRVYNLEVDEFHTYYVGKLGVWVHNKGNKSVVLPDFCDITSENSISDMLPHDLSSWLAYLESLHPKGQAGIELGLERARQVSDALGQRSFCPIITVAGTNGKGSTVAYLESILSRAGYRVGSYSSTHLLRYHERVRVGGVPVSDAALCTAFAEVEAARRAAGDVFLTYFEFGTLAAWQVFAAAGCEALTLEVGLGGRLDAVNLYDPDVALVTTVDLDHQDWLGHDRESIGFEKAGIFRAGRPALCGDAEPPQSLVEYAAKLNAPLFIMGRDFGFQQDEENRQQWRYWISQNSAPLVGAGQGRGSAALRRRNLAYPGLRGAAQLKNASLAIAALEALGDRLPVSMQAIREGLIQTVLPGRFQVLPGRPAIVLDVGHNPQAARVLAGNLAGMGFFGQTHAVLGMLADKDVAGSIAALRGKVDHWFLATLEGARGLTAAALAERLLVADPDATFSCYDNPATAFAAAEEKAGENDRILAFGSFYTVAAVLRVLNRYPVEPADEVEKQGSARKCHA